MKIQKGAFIIEVEAAMSSEVHNVESPGAPAPRQRRDGSLSNEGQVSGSVNALVGKRVDHFLLVSLLKCEWQVWWQAVSIMGAINIC